ncbi:MAG TPA: 1,4-alpha-glucan branching protein GlgB, partial [Chloroflexota bacterium]
RQAYKKLGAHPGSDRGTPGTHFAVWAPSADAVSVIGDFNGWRPAATPLYPTGDSGIWQGFVPEVGAGAAYKYAIWPRFGNAWLEKSDPFAQAAELRPHTASIVADLDSYVWNDAFWLQARPAGDWRASPVTIYEVHAGSWRRDPDDPARFLTYRELADQLPAYAADMGFTHIELMPVAEHPLDLSWGYQVTGYFAPSARFGTPSDFMYFVDRCHQVGLGVLIDWVPAHFPKDAHGLARFDGSHLYEHADPRQGEHPDWGTLIFNYGRREVQTFLLSNALFWLDCYHIDGLRVDAVASMLYLDYSREDGQWIPNRYGGRENLEAIDFLRDVNKAVHEEFPGTLTVAEESTAWPRVTGSVEEGGLGFDLKWNMGWMHDTLEYISLDPVHRRYHQGELTFSLMYAFSEHFVLPLSHDEIVHGKRSMLDKMPGDNWQKFANVRLLYTYMYGHPGKKLLFMGSEFAQWNEWKYDQSLDWHLLDLPGADGARHRGVQLLLSDLNHLLRNRPALHEVDSEPWGFQWIDYFDADASVISFLRRDRHGADLVIVVCNFTPVVRSGYRIGLPGPGSFGEILNSDAAKYGGSDVVQRSAIMAEAVPWHGQPYSAEVTLPPLAAFVLTPSTA